MDPLALVRRRSLGRSGSGESVIAIPKRIDENDVEVGSTRSARQSRHAAGLRGSVSWRFLASFCFCNSLRGSRGDRGSLSRV